MILKTILVDDEILNLKNLELILHRNFQEIEIIGKFQNVADAKIFIQKNPFDLLFLDISMPLESGFDLLNWFQNIINCARPNCTYCIFIMGSYKNNMKITLWKIIQQIKSTF